MPESKVEHVPKPTMLPQKGPKSPQSTCILELRDLGVKVSVAQQTYHSKGTLRGVGYFTPKKGSRAPLG